MGFHVRIQGFDAREWANRIYLYEHDVLYAFSIPATYGLGGRAYLGLRWQIIKQLAIYFRISETVYSRNWAAEHDRPMNRTDIHLLLRAKLSLRFAIRIFSKKYIKYICAYRKNVVSLQRIMYLSMHEFLHTRAQRSVEKE